jgi:hypothetical protein
MLHKPPDLSWFNSTFDANLQHNLKRYAKVSFFCNILHLYQEKI